MKGDFSRRIFDAHKHYAGVLHQQGRVWLDSDWNEDVFERLNLLEQETYDIVGSCGVPEPGTAFRISPNPNPSPGTPGDFLIGGGAAAGGRAYVDGILCQNDAQTSYVTQPDLPDAPAIMMPSDGSDLTALVYLEVWRRFISYLEDPSIREGALGGPDTTGRVRTIAQVRVAPVAARNLNPTCLNSALPVSGQGTLTTLTAPLSTPTDLCRLPDPGNYTGRENRLYRVEVHGAGGVGGSTPALFKWSRNNASFAVSVTGISADRLTLTVSSLGRDQATALQSGDLVEISDDASELGVAHGFLTNLASDPDPDQLTVTLSAALPFSFQAPGASVTSPPSSPPGSPPVATADRHLILRRWDGTGNANAVFDPVQTPDMDLGDGVHIQFGGSDLRSGDYWQFAARTDGSVEALMNEPPRGILRHRCPLAVVRWSVTATSPPSSPPASPPLASQYSMTVVHDCRVIFPPLAERGLHIDGVFSLSGNQASPLANDSPLSIENIGDGFMALCDAPVAPNALSRAVCFVTAYIPTQLPRVPGAPEGDIVYIPVVLQGDATASGNTITWTPRNSKIFFELPFNLQPQQDAGILATFTIRGNFVWAQGFPTIFLDGEVFGIQQATSTVTSLRLPSGDGRRGGTFETWVWLTAPAPPPPLSFTVDAAPQTVRNEGETELMSDLLLNATGGAPTAEGDAVPTVNIDITLNTNITSAPVGPGVDVVLRIDDPATLNITDFSTFPPPDLTGVGGTGLDYKNGKAPNVFQGRLSSSTTVSFAGIPMDAPGSATRVLRIMNLRANASALASQQTAAQVMATVTIKSSAFNQTMPAVSIATVQKALQVFNVLDANGVAPAQPPLIVAGSDVNPSAGQSRINLQVHFQGSAAGFFKNAGAEEGDFVSTAPALPGIGAATQGTQFEVTFTGIPPNMLFFVTMVDLSGQKKAELIAVDAKGTRPTQAGETSSGIPLAQLPAVPSTVAVSAVGIWEWTASDGTGSVQDVAFGVVLAGSPPPNEVSVVVVGNLSPVSTLVTSAAGSIPRFASDAVILKAGFSVTPIPIQ